MCTYRMRHLALVLLLFAAPAYAGWSPGGVTIKSTTNNIPLVKACSDGANGSFVAWQEETGSGPVLRATHLLPIGDLDPVWPADGALACSVATTRTQVGALPDRLGGVYMWWLEGASIYVTRLVDGHFAQGWPARGRLLGALNSSRAPGPRVIEDGAHGIYAAWGSSNSSLATAIHVGPSNTGAGGWPNGIRTLSTSADLSAEGFNLWPQIALAPDGGLFVAWASFGADMSTHTLTPGFWRLRRVTAAGTNSPGWPSEGMAFGAFDFAPFEPQYSFKSSLLALCPSIDGVYLLIGDPSADQGGGVSVSSRLLRLQGNGTSAVGWPDQGIPISGPYAYYDGGEISAYRLNADGRGGLWMRGLFFYSEFSTEVDYANYYPTGAFVGPTESQWLLDGDEFAVGSDGTAWLATSHGRGPYNAYDDWAQLHLTHAAQSLVWEYHTEPVVYWYGDIGVAATDDGGAVFYWSQFNQRYGLFARRFTAAGEVTGVPIPTGAGEPVLRARYVRGQGVCATIEIPAGAVSRLELLDVAGRRVAQQHWTSASTSSDVVLGGTGSLPTGIYFVRLTWPRHALSARVIVTE